MLPPPSHVAVSLPDGADDILRIDHPRIRELKVQYSTVDNALLSHSTWTEQYTESQMEWPYFRGDNAYIWQVRDNNQIENYRITTEYVRSRDYLGLLDKLVEDGAFGAYRYHIHDDLAVSRDLLDSILEIYFLDEHLNLSNWVNINILDIGAGYGRLAYRMAKAMPHIGKYLCVDAVAESTFLSEYYLDFRQVADKTDVILLNEVEDRIKEKKIDLAVNIHSFSECGIEAIEWWIKLLRRHEIKYFMIVPNAGRNEGKQLISFERDGTHHTYDHLLMKNNYQLIHRQPKYLDPKTQEFGVSPTYYYLYKLVN